MPAAGQFVPISPVTVLDTRNGTGGVATAPVAAGATVTFPVEGVAGIPATGVSDVFEEISGLNGTGTGALGAAAAVLQLGLGETRERLSTAQLGRIGCHLGEIVWLAEPAKL